MTTTEQISADTVQDHLRAVFDKFGIGSRRELGSSDETDPHDGLPRVALG